MSSKLSSVTLGTMRFQEKGLDAEEIGRLFEHAVDNGITSFHISHEYASYQMCCEALKKTQASKLQHRQFIAKLSSPHFDETRFDKTMLKTRIDNVLAETSIECINVAQWMWRLNPLDDSIRINRVKEQQLEIQDAFQSLVDAGKVGRFSCFPYTAEFMHTIRNLGITKTQVNYLNFWESAAIDSGLADETIVLRPLGAGKLGSISQAQLSRIKQAVNSDNDLLYHCLAFPLSSKFVSSVVVGLNTVEQIDQVAAAAAKTSVNESVFANYAKLIRTLD